MKDEERFRKLDRHVLSHKRLQHITLSSRAVNTFRLQDLSNSHIFSDQLDPMQFASYRPTCPQALLDRHRP